MPGPLQERDQSTGLHSDRDDHFLAVKLRCITLLRSVREQIDYSFDYYISSEIKLS